MTSSTQDTTPRRGSMDPAEQGQARSARRDDEQHGPRAGEARGAPRWNPDDGDYS
jgi:hypothetical protein